MMKREDYTNSTPQNTPSTQIFPTFQAHPSFLSPPRHYPETTLTPSKKPRNTPTSSEDGGGTIELSRRPRGRPPGSKNKPKPPIVITTSSHTAMSPYILELPPNSDLVDSLTRLTRRRCVGLCVLTATGAVANVTLKQPSTSTPGGTVTFHGRFDILSLSACILYSFNNNNNNTDFNTASFGGFTISLAGPQGQIVGGKVVGPLVCAGPVYVVATSFNNPSYCKLPLEIDDQDDGDDCKNEYYNEGDVSGGGQPNTSPVSEGGGGGGGAHMGLYSGQNLGNMVNYP